MKRLATALAAAVLVLAAHAVFGQTLEWNGRSGDTFTYTLCSGAAPAVSHWEICTPTLPLGASETFEWAPDREYQLKFDEEYRDGECREITIDIDRRVGRTQYAIKSGQDWKYGTIAGPACTLAIFQESPPEMPQRFSVGHAYPNPFNPSTTFRVDVPEGVYRQTVRVDVTDILGNWRRTMHYQLEEGSQTLRVDGPWRTSGVYWFRFDTGTGVFFRTATLIR